MQSSFKNNALDTPEITDALRLRDLGASFYAGVAYPLTENDHRMLDELKDRAEKLLLARPNHIEHDLYSDIVRCIDLTRATETKVVKIVVNFSRVDCAEEVPLIANIAFRSNRLEQWSRIVAALTEFVECRRRAVLRASDALKNELAALSRAREIEEIGDLVTAYEIAIGADEYHNLLGLEDAIAAALKRHQGVEPFDVRKLRETLAAERAA